MISRWPSRRPNPNPNPNPNPSPSRSPNPNPNPSPTTNPYPNPNPQILTLTRMCTPTTPGYYATAGSPWETPCSPGTYQPDG